MTNLEVVVLAIFIIFKFTQFEILELLLDKLIYQSPPLIGHIGSLHIYFLFFSNPLGTSERYQMVFEEDTHNISQHVRYWQMCEQPFSRHVGSRASSLKSYIPSILAFRLVKQCMIYHFHLVIHSWMEIEIHI